MSGIEKLPGNPQVKKHLSKLLDKTPHVLLFEGPKGVGKKEFARAFARELLETTKKDPPDLFHFYPEGKVHLHSMQSIREFIHETTLPPFEAKRRVFIIYEADRMLPSGSNALLKTLEEPLGSVVIILISSRSTTLLPTITSRCFRIPFSTLSEEDIIADLTPEKTPEKARKIALLSHGNLDKARHIASKGMDTFSEQMFQVAFDLFYGNLPAAKELEGVDAEEALSCIFYFYRDLYLLQSGASPSLLFYQDKVELFSRIAAPIPSLEVIQDQIEYALLATELNIPLAHALSKMLQLPH